MNGILTYDIWDAMIYEKVQCEWSFDSGHN